MMITPIISILFLGLSLQAYTEDGEESPHYLTADTTTECACKFVYQTRGVYQYWLGGHHYYKTGPFATNPNNNKYFTDGGVFRKGGDITSSTAFVEGDLCSGIRTLYGNIQTSHPRLPGGTSKAPKDWTANTIKSIKGCSSDRINSLSYSVNIDGTDSYKCGQSIEGYGYNGYPFGFQQDRCTYAYWDGGIVTSSDGQEYLTNVYFYWKC